MIGQTISHYKITAKLGEGGMGVVYRAEDTKLDRTVALKFITANLIKDSEARKRFEREAKAAAGVSHANVCHVYEIADADGHTFLAMEFVEGEGLDKKIERGPLALKDALDLASQAARGLAAAHARGVVHRDIKPANLLVSADGELKILDFGLALLTEGSKLTQLDTKVGTVAYMSPEQAQGMEVDHRSDIWSLGCVIYEMVCGQRPFRGAYDQALLYEIINQEVEPLTGVRTGVPMELEFIVGKCLEKDAGSRYQQVGEIAVDLRNLQDKLKSGRSTILRGQVLSQSMTSPPGITAQPPASPLVRYRVIESVEESAESSKYLAEDTELHRSVAIRVLPQSSVEKVERAQRRKQTLLVGATALTALLAVIFAFFLFSSPTTVNEAPVWRFSIAPEGLRDDPSISPDGKYVVYTTEKGNESVLWLRPLDSETPRKLEGTEGARSGYWSPDSESIVFGTDRELKRIPIDGGEPITLCELPAAGRSFPFSGASWSPDGNRIVFSSGSRLYEIPARGGEPKLLLEPDMADSAQSPMHPHFLPANASSEGLLYTNLLGANELTVWLLDLKTGRRLELFAGTRAVYSTSGHLIYDAGGRAETGLRAVPFSVEKLAVMGEPFPIADAGLHAAVSKDGTLSYVTGADTAASDAALQLVWKDRTGTTLGTIGQPQNNIGTPRLSPDGRQVAVTAQEGGQQDIWLLEVDRSVKTRFTFDDSSDVHPTWLPSGDAIAFTSDQSGPRQLYVRRLGGNSVAEPLFEPDTSVRRWLTDWADDGRFALYYQRPAGGPTGHDIWYLQRRDNDSGYEARPFLKSSFTEITGVFSPDARWVAYESDESGRPEVYVRSFPDGGAKRQVSLNGGRQPRWSDSGEIFYVDGSSSLMAVPVSTTPTLTVGQAQPLFTSPRLRSLGGVPTYDVTPDGQRFVLPEAVQVEDADGESNSGATPQRSIHIVRNWYEEFRGREKN